LCRSTLQNGEQNVAISDSYPVKQGFAHQTVWFVDFSSSQFCLSSQMEGSKNKHGTD